MKAKLFIFGAAALYAIACVWLDRLLSRRSAVYRSFTERPCGCDHPLFDTCQEKRP